MILLIAHNHCDLIGQTYDELMALAEKGDNLNLDVSTHVAAARKPEEKKSEKDPYSLLSEMKLRPLYLWGHAAGRDLCEFIPLPTK